MRAPIPWPVTRAHLDRIAISAASTRHSNERRHAEPRIDHRVAHTAKACLDIAIDLPVSDLGDRGSTAGFADGEMTVCGVPIGAHSIPTPHRDFSLLAAGIFSMAAGLCVVIATRRRLLARSALLAAFYGDKFARGFAHAGRWRTMKPPAGRGIDRRGERGRNYYRFCA